MNLPYTGRRKQVAPRRQRGQFFWICETQAGVAIAEDQYASLREDMQFSLLYANRQPVAESRGR